MNGWPLLRGVRAALNGEVARPERAWRSDGERRWGAVITDAGRVTIGVEPDKAPAEISDEAADPGAAAIPAESAGEQVDRIAAPVTKGPPTKRC